MGSGSGHPRRRRRLVCPGQGRALGSIHLACQSARAGPRPSRRCRSIPVSGAAAGAGRVGQMGSTQVEKSNVLSGQAAYRLPVGERLLAQRLSLNRDRLLLAPRRNLETWRESCPRRLAAFERRNRLVVTCACPVLERKAWQILGARRAQARGENRSRAPHRRRCMQDTTSDHNVRPLHTVGALSDQVMMLDRDGSARRMVPAAARTSGVTNSVCPGPCSASPPHPPPRWASLG